MRGILDLEQRCFWLPPGPESQAEPSALRVKLWEGRRNEEQEREQEMSSYFMKELY